MAVSGRPEGTRLSEHRSPPETRVAAPRSVSSGPQLPGALPGWPGAKACPSRPAGGPQKLPGRQTGPPCPECPVTGTRLARCSRLTEHILSSQQPEKGCGAKQKRPVGRGPGRDPAGLL